MSLPDGDGGREAVLRELDGQLHCLEESIREAELEAARLEGKRQAFRDLRTRVASGAWLTYPMPAEYRRAALEGGAE